MSNWTRINVAVSGSRLDVDYSERETGMLNIQGVPGNQFETYGGSMPRLTEVPPEQQVEDALQWWSDYCAQIKVEVR